MRGTYGSLLQMATCVGILGALVAGLPVAHVSGWYGSHLVTTVSVLLLFESKRENQPNYYGYSILHLLVLKCEHVYGSLS